MKKWIAILLLLVPLWSCVGQKEDPDPGPEPVEPVDPGGQDEGTAFFRRVLATGFTATWCQYCPDMSNALSEAAVDRPGRFVTMAVHYEDELSPAEDDALVSLFKVRGYPSLVFDWDISTLCSGRIKDELLAYVDKAMEKEACGIAAESSVKDGILNVSVTVKSVRTASYAVVAALLEDGIKVANQAGYGSSYTCNAVLRGFLPPGTDGNSIGSIDAGKEGSALFSCAAPEVTDNKRIVVFALEDGIVSNALSLGLEEKIGYTYEKED